MPERAVAESVADLLAGATDRRTLATAGKSGARLERVRIGGESYVVKYLDLAHDWTMRAAGCLGGGTLALWRQGVLDLLPECLNQPIVGVAHETRHADWSSTTVLLMRDVGAWLVPTSEKPLEHAHHRGFVRHMAALHAAFWDAGPECEVVPSMHRYLELSPWTAIAESDTSTPPLVPRLIGEGWPRLAAVAPRAAEVVTPLAWDPGPLVAALASTPPTLVHGNWKLDNLGTDPCGRTVLLDWEQPGRGPALSDLAWYLAINCRRLPEPKEVAIDAYRAALERHGIDTAPWWERQLALCLLGALVQFGWEKALGGYDEELAWWEGRAIEGARFLP